MSFCNPNCQKWTLVAFALVCLTLGLLLVFLWEDLCTEIKHEQLNLGKRSTIAFKMWEKTPIPMYIEFYLFDWVNVERVKKSGWKEKPLFEQRGPYTFKEVHIRKDIVFNENKTLTYKTQRIWYFEPELSNGTLDDKITTINTILATVASFVKQKHAVVQIGVNFFLEEYRVNLTVTKTAREFLFDGYDDPMLQLIKQLNMTSLNIPFDKFGWFYGRNESIEYDGVFNMYDGTDSLDNLGRIVNWNYENDTEFWPGQCGKVVGTSGELWYPVGDAKQVDIFGSDSCSTMTLFYAGDVFKHGIKAHRYEVTERLYDNGTKYPEMGCFSYGESLPSGVRNVSRCKFNATAFISNPHFYLADESYRQDIVGMMPDKSQHEFFIAIEPETGIPMQVQAAVQINIRIEPMHRIKVLKDVKTLMIPTMWFKQYAQVDEDLASQAKTLLILPSIGIYTGYGIIGMCCLLAAIVVFVSIRRGWDWRGTDEESLLSDEISDDKTS